MGIKFRKLRVGFANLILDFLEGQDKAVKLSREATDYLKKNLDLEIVE